MIQVDRPSSKSKPPSKSLAKVANPPGMGGRLLEFNSISRLPSDVAREIPSQI